VRSIADDHLFANQLEGQKYPKIFLGIGLFLYTGELLLSFLTVN